MRNRPAGITTIKGPSAPIFSRSRKVWPEKGRGTECPSDPPLVSEALSAAVEVGVDGGVSGFSAQMLVKPGHDPLPFLPIPKAIPPDQVRRLELAKPIRNGHLFNARRKDDSPVGR
ncbi:MAG: hypothetical protein ACREU9_06970, partial [Gammaproteobacteria bacterium]